MGVEASLRIRQEEWKAGGISQTTCTFLDIDLPHWVVGKVVLSSVR
jgi:hypothetical protein